jgi:hypothetical protein
MQPAHDVEEDEDGAYLEHARRNAEEGFRFLLDGPDHVILLCFRSSDLPLLGGEHESGN